VIFDNRQLATLILLGLLLAWLLTKPDVRRAIADVGRTLVGPKVLIPFLLYAAWLVGLHWLSWRIGLWNAKLTGESLFWAGISGLALLTLSVTEAGKHDNFFRNKLVDTVKFGAFFEFFINIKSLSLLGELVFQPILALLVGARVVAARDEKSALARKFLDTVLSLATVALLFYTLRYLVQDWDQIDKGQEVRKLLMPVWLTLGAFPFAFVFALIADYGQVFNRMKAGNDWQRTALRARLGVVLALRTRLIDIHSFDWPYAQQAGRARTIHEGMEAVRDFRAKRDREASEERSEQARLEALAGVEGVDMEGRQLDQREFEETRDALRWVATCQSGWYQRQGGRYRVDILEIIGGFKRQGLPDEHGIVVKVRRDGKAWYAYRRTVTGWVLGIGSRKAPPDEWYYEGSEPPQSYPRPGHGWGAIAHADTPSWK
jgi:hypothetical protein